MASFSEVSSLVDKGVNKGVFKQNKASRVRSAQVLFVYKPHKLFPKKPTVFSHCGFLFILK